MSEEDDLVLLSVAAAEVGLSKERLRQLIHAGDLGAKRLGMYWFVPKREVRRLKREQDAKRAARPNQS